MAKRVLYVVGAFPSVTETFIDREITGLRALGLEVVVSPLHDGLWTRAGCAALPCWRQLLATLRALRSDPTRPRSRRLLSAALRAAEIAARDADCDHIHAHFLGLPATVAYCLSQLLDKPYSLTAHARDIYAESTPEIVLQDAKFRTTCTEKNRQYLLERYPDFPFHLVRHGLDPLPYARQVPVSARALCRILAVGRMVEKKGFGYFLEACHILKERPLQWRASLVGDGPLFRDLRGKIAYYGLEHHVTLTGFKAHGEVIRLLHDVDILVVPSVIAHDGDRDGVPNIILEAMAARTPVVTTSAGAIEEVVENRYTGRIVEQRNARALAAAIEELWWSPKLREVIVDTAYQRLCREFHPAKWNRRLYELLVNGHSAAPPSVPLPREGVTLS